MKIALWIVQVLLAIAFFMSGMMKLVSPIEEIAKNAGTWALEMPALVRFIGVAEVAGALGLILPAATRIKPILTPLAACGLLLVMILAALFHASRGEFSSIGANVLLGGLAAFVAWGRLKKVPILPR
jgi:putative oxidoreductase